MKIVFNAVVATVLVRALRPDLKSGLNYLNNGLFGNSKAIKLIDGVKLVKSGDDYAVTLSENYAGLLSLCKRKGLKVDDIVKLAKANGVKVAA